jgi:hypothetical protein
MSNQDELAQLQAERDRLLSMIAYHNEQRNEQRISSTFRAPPGLVVIAIGIICGIGLLIMTGIFAGQISASGVLFLVVGLLLLAYILTRKVEAFGVKFRVGDLFAMPPTGQLAGEPEVRQRLTDCEARIMKLKEGRS